MPRPAVSARSVTPTAIAIAALAILDEEGPDALSFRRVGAALDTSHTTIHRHCGSFEGLLDLCADHLAGELPDIAPALDWATSTTLRFTAVYEIWTAHPALITLQRGRPWSGPRMLARFVEPALRANLDAGLTPGQMIQTFRQMYLFTLGCSMTHATYAARQARTIIAALDPEEFPVLTTYLNVVVGSVVERDVFRVGLRNLIAAAVRSLAAASDGGVARPGQPVVSE
jgi:AcrR family transcriptional regulator